MLSNTCKYAVRAVIYLAVWQNGDTKIGIKRIAKELNLPTPFLGKILQLLTKHKLLNSTKGPNGGFSLAKPANEISLYDIVTIIDGNGLFEECMIGLKICEIDKSKEIMCPFYQKSHPIRSKILSVFKEQSVGEFASGIKKFGDILNF